MRERYYYYYYYYDGGPITYPPSILMVGDNFSSTLQLQQRLENNGCRVCRLDFDSRNQDMTCRPYFDVIVFNLEQPDEDRLETYRQLKADLELAQTPLIVLTPERCLADTAIGLKSGKVYCLSGVGADDACVEAQVLQIIEHILYMTDRYM
jgi:CheY-like chemotaxis protein